MVDLDQMPRFPKKAGFESQVQISVYSSPVRDANGSQELGKQGRDGVING